MFTRWLCGNWFICVIATCWGPKWKLTLTSAVPGVAYGRREVWRVFWGCAQESWCLALPFTCSNSGWNTSHFKGLKDSLEFGMQTVEESLCRMPSKPKWKAFLSWYISSFVTSLTRTLDACASIWCCDKGWHSWYREREQVRNGCVFWPFITETKAQLLFASCRRLLDKLTFDNV